MLQENSNKTAFFAENMKLKKKELTSTYALSVRSGKLKKEK